MKNHSFFSSLTASNAVHLIREARKTSSTLKTGAMIVGGLVVLLIVYKVVMKHKGKGSAAAVEAA